MGADQSAENTPKPQKFSAQFVRPSPKVLDFQKKALFGCPQSVVLPIQKEKLSDSSLYEPKNVMNMKIKQKKLENFSEGFSYTTLLSLVKPSNPVVSTRLDNKTKKLNVPNPPLRPLLAQSVIASCLDLVKEIQSKNILRMERKTLSQS